MHDFRHLNSTEDDSVNFIFNKDNSFLEARFVQRNANNFIVYLSSQNGCNNSCRFCHLTQTKQTDFVQTTLSEYKTQAKSVLEFYKYSSTNPLTVDTVYYNFMARGEPLQNPVVMGEWDTLRKALYEEQKLIGIEKAKFKLSTIIPEDVKEIDHFIKPDTFIYYSLYSMNSDFRKRWLPKAKDVNESLDMLKHYQENGGNVVFHWAFIEGENDSEQNTLDICEALSDFKNVRVNIVRYNPYSSGQGKESSEEVIKQHVRLLTSCLNAKVKVIQRVGFDVKTSCGMFINE